MKMIDQLLSFSSYHFVGVKLKFITAFWLGPFPQWLTDPSKVQVKLHD